jgi:hypothetical protein
MSVVKQSKTASATQAAPLHEFDDVLGSAEANQNGQIWVLMCTAGFAALQFD